MSSNQYLCCSTGLKLSRGPRQNSKKVGAGDPLSKILIRGGERGGEGGEGRGGEGEQGWEGKFRGPGKGRERGRQKGRGGEI